MCVLLASPLWLAAATWAAAPRRATTVAIKAEDFYINGEPTLRGRTWRGHRVEGLLPNARLVQGVFDDRNPETRSRWAYPDTATWDPERNTREFVAAMREWRRRGLLAFTVNLQGGSPGGLLEGAAVGQLGDRRGRLPALRLHGSPGADPRRGRSQGMVVILGVFYFGQDERLSDEAAVVRAVTRRSGC